MIVDAIVAGALYVDAWNESVFEDGY